MSQSELKAWFKEDPSRWDVLTETSKMSMRNCDPYSSPSRSRLPRISGPPSEPPKVVLKVGGCFLLKRDAVKITTVRNGRVYHINLDTGERANMDVGDFARLAIPVDMIDGEVRLDRSHLDRLIIEAFAEGLSSYQVAQIVGLTSTTVSQIAKRHGVKSTHKRLYKGEMGERTKAILVALKSGHFRVAEIAEKVGISKQRVSQIAIANGVKSQYEKRVSKVLDLLSRTDDAADVAIQSGEPENFVRRVARKHNVSLRYKPSLEDKVMELIRQERPYREIAVLCGCAPSYVSWIAVKNGIRRRKVRSA